jgi:hypothetical protein
MYDEEYGCACDEQEELEDDYTTNNNFKQEVIKLGYEQGIICVED